MKYLLDTNICIFLMKGLTKVVETFSVKRFDGAAISAITLAELEHGVYKSTAIQNNKARLDTFLTTVEILPFDSLAAAEFGRIKTQLQKQGTPIGELDTLIAAHAKSEGLICVTNNVREFERVNGLIVEDWTVE